MTTAPDAPPRPLSPNSVLANALLRSIDMIRPKVVAARPRRIVFVVGTQVNGAPHLGTSIVQTSAFLLARLARRAFSVDTDYELDTYTGQQATPAYRTEFLRSLEDFDALRWWLASRTGCSRQRHGLALPTATSMP